MTEVSVQDLIRSLRACAGHPDCSVCVHSDKMAGACVQNLAADAAAMIEGLQVLSEQQARKLNQLRKLVFWQK